ncbi:hypothetical protein Cpir12675_005552 [Ceratocystis pirilliformis]|uniref:Phosphatidylinositol-specific phospholipase C X domain-containing protein n=1 Tax=Ceratocystis pirilliformis TaxID=259994 RepID=A0ABR3YP04_9PEZI
MRFPHFIILAFVGFSYAGNFKGIEDKWSFDLGNIDHSDWMSDIDDNVLLSKLSIPGTHNSMTAAVQSSLTRTQNEHLSDQLTGGIRYIDISCRYVNNEMMVYNGVSETGFSLGDVLHIMFEFLDAHPRETLILRIQKGGILGDSKKLAQFIEQSFAPDSEIGDRAAQHIYFRNVDDISIPTLGEVRGKVFILQDFKNSQPALYGIPWNKDTVSSYSHRLASGSLFLGLKWDGVRSHLSQSHPKDINKLRITHTTASAGVKPISIAAKNLPGYGMNGLLGRYLMSDEGDCFGIIVMDFPGCYLVQHILELNNQYQAPGLHSFSLSPSAPPLPEWFDNEGFENVAPSLDASYDGDGDDTATAGLVR